jgi:hypothetical protein
MALPEGEGEHSHSLSVGTIESISYGNLTTEHREREMFSKRGGRAEGRGVSDQRQDL